MKAIYVDTDAQGLRNPVPFQAPYKPRWIEYVWFFIGSIVLASTTIGFVFGLFLWFGDTKRPNKSQPGTLWLLCNFIGMWATILAILFAALCIGVWLLSGAAAS
jgi:hypothetical protein